MNYTSWRCYNAFGYRLYNYVLPSVISVLVQSITQAVFFYKEKESSEEKPAEKSTEKPTKKFAKCQAYFKWFLLTFTILLNSAIVLVFIPYFITNALPMLVGFCWVLMPILGLLILAYVIFVLIVVSIIDRCKMCKEKFVMRMFATHCAVGLQVFGCLIVSMAYNYSQYCYFEGGYLPVLGYELQSRDTVTWANNIANNSQLIAHNILAFF
jgi:hypothetical protein